MNTEDYYNIWIETDKAKKYRNSDKYRHSEMMAFAKSWGKQQNKELRKKADILNWVIRHFERYGYPNKTEFEAFLLTLKQRLKQ